MNPKTISIGIPAFNEGLTIKTLLESIVSQKPGNYILKEIIIISDGSTDQTIEKVKQIHDKRIKIIDDKRRLGKSSRLNQILSMFTSDVLFLIDADITIKDEKLFNKIVEKADFKRAGIVGLNATPLQGTNWFENALNYSVLIQAEMRKRLNGGRNYLAFRGAFIGIHGKLAKSITLPDKLVNNDAYFYFIALQNGYSPIYLPDVVIYYKSPTTFSDHLKQSSRFQVSEHELSKYIAIPEEEYLIPKKLVINLICKYFLINPFLFLSYTGIALISKIRRKKRVFSKWSVAASTKTAIER